MNRQTAAMAFLVALTILATFLTIQAALALPGGAGVENISATSAATRAPGSRDDPRATITTIILNAVQQDQYWKAYVGNISGKLSLDDAVGNTIYDWSITTSKNGQVFVSRGNTVNFANLSCVNSSNLNNENTFFSFGASDNVNVTFGQTSHGSIAILGTTQVIAQNTCNSTATYLNNVSQTMNGNQKFQEILLQDDGTNVVYATIIDANTTGFDGKAYDFQMIVPEKASGAATSYYFYTQLTG
jgi:hypothetical protein